MGGRFCLSVGGSRDTTGFCFRSGRPSLFLLQEACGFTHLTLRLTRGTNPIIYLTAAIIKACEAQVFGSSSLG
jgi:hypothetical protein